MKAREGRGDGRTHEKVSSERVGETFPSPASLSMPNMESRDIPALYRTSYQPTHKHISYTMLLENPVLSHPC